ncbi:MAG: DUF378 domain-containing protein [Candidatus Obscuribacterales bacterium]|nr:DUF378 domain-containing protein [Candidatus Melainabacteria bacterium]
MKHVELIATILLLVGGINWGLVGAFDYNLVTSLLGDGTATKVVYGLVGLCALYQIMQHMKGRGASEKEA